MKKTCLLDLPVYPEDRDMACATDTISDTYLAERDAIGSGEELRGFVSRWHNLWLLTDDYDKLTKEEQCVIDNKMDYDRVYSQLLRKSENGLDFNDINVKIMTHIAMPIPFLQAHQVSKHYGVGSDLAMVRLYLDPFSQYNDAMRCGSGDPRPKIVGKIMDE
jgi:hypothetical protein